MSQVRILPGLPSCFTLANSAAATYFMEKGIAAQKGKVGVYASHEESDVPVHVGRTRNL
jgi:hypothetical protein